MIPFFRKLRKKLADDNQFLKYSRYAIGEILLVVIGILIAIQINNWNEERVINQTIKTYLNSLVEDLNNDIRRLESHRENQLFRYYCMQQLLILSNHRPNSYDYGEKLPPFTGFGSVWDKPIPEKIEADFVKIAFVHSNRLNKIAPKTSTMVELKSSGLFSYINNQVIKNSINNYYDNFDWRLGESENHNIFLFRDNWTNTLALNGYNSDEMTNFKGAIKWLENDLKAVADLRNLINNAKWRYKSCDALISKAQELITLINSSND